MLPEFELLVPRTLSEALILMSEKSPDVMPLAGGTNVIVELRDSRHAPASLMDISRLPELRGTRKQNGYIVIGGGTTITELLAHPLIATHGLPLRQAAAVFANPLICNRATVAGNLVDASPAADTAPPLLSLDAEVELVSQAGSRWVPLQDFLVGVRKTLIRPDELLRAVRWPVPLPGSAGAFYKLGLRKADAISVLNAAVVIERDAAGGCAQARIALGAVAPRPIRAHEAEQALQGQRLKAEVIAEAARLAAEAAQPISDTRGTMAYRKRVTEVAVRRLLTQIAETLALSRSPERSRGDSEGSVEGADK